MNSFNIIKSKGASLQNLKKINTILYVCVVLLPTASIQTSLLKYIGVDEKLILIFVVFFIISVLISMYLYSRYVKKHISTIGEISVASNGLNKTILGLNETIQFADIISVKIKNYLRANSTNSKYGSHAYLVIITKKDNTKEQFIIEGNTKIGRNYVDFSDLLQKAEKLSKHKFKIIRR